LVRTLKNPFMNFVSNVNNNAQSVDIEIKVETFGIVTLREFRRLYVNIEEFSLALNNQNYSKHNVLLNDAITRVKVQLFIDFRATPNIPDKGVKITYTLSNAGANPSQFVNEFTPASDTTLNTDYLILVK
jgi:hypothetical protein